MILIRVSCTLSSIRIRAATHTTQLCPVKSHKIITVHHVISISPRSLCFKVVLPHVTIAATSLSVRHLTIGHHTLLLSHVVATSAPHTHHVTTHTPSHVTTTRCHATRSLRVAWWLVKSGLSL